MSNIWFIVFLIFTNGLPSQAQTINWNGHWASQCDFAGNDLSNQQSTDERCGGLCESIPECTHFAWNRYNGGTCWLKKGSVTKDNALFTGDWETMCGIKVINIVDPGNTAAIKWNGHWASQCDFDGNDLYFSHIISEKCSGLCDSIPECTHFAWNRYKGGTCWLKKGLVTKDNALFTGDWQTTCGLSIRNLIISIPIPSILDPLLPLINILNRHPERPWMSAIVGSTQIGSISIPGTHGSGNLYNKDSLGYARTQTKTISEQLNSGIRYLDIRCRHLLNAFTIHHGLIYQDLNFNDVLIMATKFLEQNPSETVLMRVTEEHTPYLNTRRFHETFNEYFTKYSRFFWKNNNINPPLEELRGKIMVIQSFDSPIKYGPLLNSFDVQDNYEPKGDIFGGGKVEDKQKSIFESFAKAQSPPLQMIINHLSAYSKSVFKPITPLGFAERMNPYMLSLISGRKRNYVGIIAADFPDFNLINAIVQLNFQVQ